MKFYDFWEFYSLESLEKAGLLSKEYKIEVIGEGLRVRFDGLGGLW
jgi:hypothetical protein